MGWGENGLRVWPGSPKYFTHGGEEILVGAEASQVGVT